MILFGYGISCISGMVDKKARLNKELLALMVKEPNLKKNSLKKIKAKTLVVNGNRDMIRVGHAKSIANTINNAELKIVKGNHFYLFMEPDSFNKIVLDFMSK
jgi:pimeloyl-ACP methyl ester carboxylesterase